MRLDHVNIAVRDFDAVRDFLVAVLGLSAGPRPAFDFPGHWLYLDGQPIIHLRDPVGAAGEAGWVNHIAFAPFDFDAKVAELDRAGIGFRASAIPGTDIRQIFVAGPEGVMLELQCPAGAA